MNIDLSPSLDFMKKMKPGMKMKGKKPGKSMFGKKANVSMKSSKKSKFAEMLGKMGKKSMLKDKE